MSEEQEYRSDFGKGFAYCLALFAMHWERVAYSSAGEARLSSWFYGAADHLSEIETDPAILGVDIAEKVQKLTDTCYVFTGLDHPPVKVEDVKEAVQLALEILRMWDEKCGIETVKGRWE